MDDCNLKSLKVKPGELSFVFKPDAVEYKATVGSKVATVTILCETSDRNASVSISVSIIMLHLLFIFVHKGANSVMQQYRAAV